MTCTPTGNPADHEPKAGNNSSGQNEDGYDERSAVDAVDPDAEIYAVDSAGNRSAPVACLVPAPPQ